MPLSYTCTPVFTTHLPISNLQFCCEVKIKTICIWHTAHGSHVVVSFAVSLAFTISLIVESRIKTQYNFSKNKLGCISYRHIFQMVILYLKIDSLRTRFSFRRSSTRVLNNKIFGFDMNRVQQDCISFDTTITIVRTNSHVVDISYI